MNDFEQRVRRSFRSVADEVPSGTGDAKAPTTPRRAATGLVAAAAALLVIAVPVGLVVWLAGGESDTPPVATGTPSISPPGTTSAGPTTSPPVTTATPIPVTPQDRALVRAFVAFAVDPTASTAASVPFAADGVRLGLGPRLLSTVRLENVGDPASWSVNYPNGYWRARTGPFSALRTLDRHVTEGGTGKIPDSSGDIKISIGEHPHCASAPVAPPGAVSDMRRVSIQPADSSITSCIQWFTVDLFVNADGEIAAVTVDYWEP